MRPFIGKTLHFQILFLFLTSLFCFDLGEAVDSEPQHEFEKPGFNDGHAYDGILPNETIDLFTGALIISQRDVHLESTTTLDVVDQLITRRYNSKIFRQEITGQGCSTTVPSTPVGDDNIGQGWSLHFGRLWDDDQFGLPDGHPVLELPDGSRHIFSIDTNFPSRMITKSGWILYELVPASRSYKACSPHPDTVCMTFTSKIAEYHNGRFVLHAYFWLMYGDQGAVIINMDKDTSDHFWFTNLNEGCFGNPIPYMTVFTWDTTPPTQTLTTISYLGANDQTYTVTYQYITQNGRKLLEQVKNGAGAVTRYEYDPITNELIRMKISTDSTIDDNDLVIEYTYEDHAFRINPFFLSSACTRVVTQKRLKKSDGTFDVWTYQYPSANDPIHKVIVTDPKANRREVTYQGYSSNEPYVWNVGTILRDEYFEGGTSLISEVSTYDFKEVTAVLDPEASLYDTVKIPVLLNRTKTYSQTGQQTITSFGTAANYDRYGNPDFKTETNFDSSLLRKTEYIYEHRDGDKDDSVMEEKHFVHRISNMRVLESGGATISETEYEHYDDPAEARFGAVKNELVWDSESISWIRTTYDYDWYREQHYIYEQTDGPDWMTENFGCNGNPVWVTDALEPEAGPLFHADVQGGAFLYTATYPPSYEPTTSYIYDGENRLTQITPSIGDTTIITYDDTNRKVTVTQGTSSSVEEYDNRGRLTKRQVYISSGVVSTQTFEYDSLNNLTKQSEKTIDPTPTTFIDKTYDALNRVISITTADGTTTYTYNGPDVTVIVQSESGPLITTMKYDAAGRLIKVVEPNGIATTYAYDVIDRLIRVCHQDNDDICAAGHAFKRTFVYSSRGKLLSETHPESGTTTYKYDILGRMVEKKLAGMTNPIRYTYDMRDRLLSVDYPGDPDVSFYYDGDYSSRPVPGYENQPYVYPRGHLTGMVDSTGTTLWVNHWYRRELLLKEIHLSGTSPYISLQYTYDSRGNLESIKYPSGQIVKTYRNDANAINQITRKFGAGAETNLLNSVSYNAALLPSSLSYANGINLGISSDVRNRPDIINSPQKLTLDYRYNVRGLIDQIITGQNGGPNQVRDITYDNLGRISTFNAALNYNFDIFGNLLSKTGALSAGPFTYTNNRIDGVSYSAPGNQLSANGKTLTYNEENRLVQVVDGSTNTFYSYDGKGNRVKSVDALTGKTRFFIYDDAGTLLSEMSQLSGGTRYIDKEYVNGPSGTLATAALDEIPRGLKIYDLNLKARLEWTPSTNCGIAGYNVYRSTTQNGTYTLQNTNGPITTGFYDDANVVECTTYWYQIKTVYTGGAEGSASEKKSHKFINYKAVLYNSPSPGVAPLTVTFTYNKGGTCPAVGSTSYSLDFGDGITQNFTSPGTVNHTYTTASKCYPFCIAKLTVTFNNGIVATQSRLTSMSTDLVANENFDDDVADGFTVSSGTWHTGSGTYTGSSTGTAWGISLSNSSCNKCVIAAQANTVNQTNKNAYVIFGYINNQNFQYAGYEISPNRWVIGDVVNNVNTVRASFTQALATGVWHSLEVKLDAATKTVYLKGNGVTRVMYTFSKLYSLPIGFAVKGAAQSSFDNFKIAPAYTITTLHSENFNDGQAQGYVPVTGTWSIVSSRYRGTIATTTDAVSQTPVATFNSGIIAGDIRVVTSNGWYVFDYVNSTNFKFAGIDEPADKWVIGDVVNGTKTYRASFVQVLNANTIYPVKVLLEGSTVTVVNSNVIKVRYTFASLTARPVGMGMRGSATCDFDNVSIYTETFPSGPVSNPPAVPPPTSTAGAADVAAISYANPPFYYHLNDHLGTARITMNQAGAVTASVEYYPFGELKSFTGCAANNQKFTGKLFDNESGLQYFGARYFSNDLTRFTSVDPAGESLDLENPQSFNRYPYSLNNPISLVDPDGRDARMAMSQEEFRTYLNSVEPLTVRDAVNIIVGAAVIAYTVYEAADAIWYAGAAGLYGLKSLFSRGGQAVQPRPIQPYNRQQHYGRTPTSADRKALGTKPGEVVNHEPALVKRYYEGDTKTGEKPGRSMTPAERRTSANDRSRMNNQPEKESQKQGGHMSNYSKEKKKELNKQ